MKLGFTGTQEGMSARQKAAFRQMLRDRGVTELHHGDCVGADSDAHDIAVACGVPRIVIHPPEDPVKRAWCHRRDNGTTEVFVKPEKDYLPRNRDIVNQTQMLTAAPRTMVEVIRSGTWATVRFARSKGKEDVLLDR